MRAPRIRWFVPLLLLVTGCKTDLSWKSVTFKNVNFDQVFDICHQHVRVHFQGRVIRTDKKAGHIETDPVTFQTSKGQRREQAYVDLKTLEDEALEIAVFAPMSKQVFDLDKDPPYQWIILGSDVKVERILLDEISASILDTFPEALMVAENRGD